jgi:hypothetical protein
MSSKSLNESFIAEAVHLLHNGQMKRVKAMGLNDDEIAALSRPEIPQLLAHSTAKWLDTSVNHTVVASIINRSDELIQEHALISRMILANASSDMLANWYGLNHQAIALMRKIQKLPLRKGRRPEITKDEEKTLWNKWSASIRDGDLDLRVIEQLRMFALVQAEEMDIDMMIVWQYVERWVKQGVM